MLTNVGPALRGEPATGAAKLDTAPYVLSRYLRRPRHSEESSFTLFPSSRQVGWRNYRRLREHHVTGLWLVTGGYPSSKEEQTFQGTEIVPDNATSDIYQQVSFSVSN